MSQTALSFSTRKALCVHLGDAAGKELADLLQRISDRMDHLDRNKVDVTPIVRVIQQEASPQGELRRAA